MYSLRVTNDGYRRFYNASFADVKVDDLTFALNDIKEKISADSVVPYKALVFYPCCMEKFGDNFNRILSDICSNCSVIEVKEDIGNILICTVDSNTSVEDLVVDDKTVGKKTIINGIQYYDVCNMTNDRTVADGAYEEVYKDFYKIVKSFEDMQLIRTWCWLKDILEYYNEFNSARNTTFKKIGFISEDGVKLPASTGVGPYCSDNNFFILDLLFVDKNTEVKFWYSTGKQQSAFDYGSAFSRMVCIHKYDRREFYLSGTAAILNNGESYAIGDIEKQIYNMIENVEAALKCESLGMDDICYGFVYCKNREIYEVLNKTKALKDYNVSPIIADICRDELLLEMEVYAAK